MNQFNTNANLVVSKKKLRLYQDKVLKNLSTLNLHNLVKPYKGNDHNNLTWHILDRRYDEVNSDDETRSKVFIKYYLLNNVLIKFRENLAKKIECEPIFLFVLQQLQFVYDIKGDFKVIDDKKYFVDNLKEIIYEYPNTNRFVLFNNANGIILDYIKYHEKISSIKTLQDLKKTRDVLNVFLYNVVFRIKNGINYINESWKELNVVNAGDIVENKVKVSGNKNTKDIDVTIESNVCLPDLRKIRCVLAGEFTNAESCIEIDVIKTIEDLEERKFKYEFTIPLEFLKLNYRSRNWFYQKDVYSIGTLSQKLINREESILSFHYLYEVINDVTVSFSLKKVKEIINIMEK